MKIAIGADHAGFVLKQKLRAALEQQGHQVTDHGTHSEASTDYPEYAAKVGRDVAEGRADRGVLVCSTGVGMSIAANKIPGVRAGLATGEEEVFLMRSHNDANVIAFAARYMDEATANALLAIFLKSEFEGGRHARRVAKITELEGTNE